MNSSRRGDVLRAFDRLGVDKYDHQLRDDIAGLLGMAWEPAMRARTTPLATMAPLLPPVASPPLPHWPSKHLENERALPATVDPPVDPVPEPFGLARVKSPERRLP